MEYLPILYFIVLFTVEKQSIRSKRPNLQFVTDVSLFFKARMSSGD